MTIHTHTQGSNGLLVEIASSRVPISDPARVNQWHVSKRGTGVGQHLGHDAIYDFQLSPILMGDQIRTAGIDGWNLQPATVELSDCQPYMPGCVRCLLLVSEQMLLTKVTDSELKIHVSREDSSIILKGAL